MTTETVMPSEETSNPQQHTANVNVPGQFH